MIADRRQLLRFAAAAALMPAFMSRSAGAAPTARFAPPPGPMRYTRELRRELGVNAALTVSRSFAVRFVPLAGGYRVEGEQVEVRVDAPEELAQFAALERQRREIGLFPLLLDGAGLIHGAEVPVDTAQLDIAVRQAIARFAHAGASPDELAEHQRFVSALHQGAAAILTALPKDLFAPGDPDRTTRQNVALPDGAAGEVTVRFTAQADPGTGLMERAMREVLTELSGERRRTVEDWNLAPL